MDSRTAQERNTESRQNTKDIIVIGGGGHAKVVISILRKLNEYSMRGYTDPRGRCDLLGIPFLGSDEEVRHSLSDSLSTNLVIAVGQVGTGRARCEIWHRLSSPSVGFPAIISPDAIVNEDVTMFGGSVVMDGAIINAGASVGFGCIVNTHATIEHDVILGDWVHVAPGATISGGVAVGGYSMIGAGAIIIEGRTVAADTIIGAGATVVRDLTEPGVYVGTPARRIR